MYWHNAAGGRGARLSAEEGTGTVEKLPFLPLPLFLSVRVLLPFTKRRFGFFGASVAPAVLHVTIREIALEMGAVLGRARPDLVQLSVRCACDRPGDPERVRFLTASLAEQADKLLANAGDPETFGDLLALEPAGFDAVWSDPRAVVEVEQLAGTFGAYSMLGLEFGVRQPALTRTFVENKIADSMGEALVKAGLKLPPGTGFKSYEEEEQAVLAMADDWQRQWGPKVEGWLRMVGVEGNG